MSPERIILMYISEVSGHHNATLAIEKAIKILSSKAEILNINAFNYTNPISEKIVNCLYMSVIQRTPKIWDYLYDNPKVIKKIEGLKAAIHKFNSPKLKILFNKFKPDAIACTQAFPCGMVADFKKTYNSAIPLVAVLTDYIPHSYWIYDSIDYYITPSQEVTNRLIKKGVLPGKIKSYGIPIDPKFNADYDRNKITQKLKLEPNLFTLLVMGGGHGLGPIKKIIGLLNKIKTELQIIVVTGINRKLYNFLIKNTVRYKKRVLAFEYIDNIDELMSVSDIIITKPGGITTAEALAKNIPMIIVRPIPGQEVSNTFYLTQMQAAIKIDRLNDITAIVEDLTANPAKLKSFSESARGIGKPNASLDIAKLLLNLCREND